MEMCLCSNVQEKDKCCYLNRSQVYRKSIWVRQNHISIYIVLIYLDVQYNKSGLFHNDFTPLNRCFFGFIFLLKIFSNSALKSHVFYISYLLKINSKIKRFYLIFLEKSDMKVEMNSNFPAFLFCLWLL